MRHFYDKIMTTNDFHDFYEWTISKFSLDKFRKIEVSFAQDSPVKTYRLDTNTKSEQNTENKKHKILKNKTLFIFVL